MLCFLCAFCEVAMLNTLCTKKKTTDMESFLAQVDEMNEEVERHQVIRDSLELELQVLRQTLSSVGNFTENADSGNSITQRPEEHTSMSVLLLSSLNEFFFSFY